MAPKKFIKKSWKGLAKRMEKLEFPVISGPLPGKKELSMDDYLQFVLFNLKNTSDIEANRKWKKLQAVKIPFFLLKDK